MRSPGSVRSLETLGRVRLSKHYFMRDFLYSEIANHYGQPNIPEDPDTAIAAGQGLCQALLDPLTETFGPLHIRSSYRSPSLNAFGNDRTLNCGSNEFNRAGHIWDSRMEDGSLGACACIVVPWFADRYAEGRDWRDLAWWIHDHLPYARMTFFQHLAAFNLTWREKPVRRIDSWIGGPGCKLLWKEGQPEPDERARYADFPPFRGIHYP